MKSIGAKLSTRAGSSKSNPSQVKYEGSRTDYCSSSTPTQSKRIQLPNLTTQLYSPILSQTTEEHENVEVVWNWQSPRSRSIRKQKRIDINNSPKLVINKCPSDNGLPIFDKLNQELKCLTSQVVETSDDKNELSDNNLNSVFDDSMEAELLVCSQKVEQKFLKDKLVGMKTPNRTSNPEISETCSASENMCLKDSCNINNNVEVKSITSIKTETPNKIADDSFDIAIQALGDEDMDFSFSNKKIKTSPISLAKVEITDAIVTSSLTQCTLEEIENKRKQALEKLQKKKPSSCETSPVKCSQEEIEKKRLQAIAKLEAKKKQDLIERNRREALKRLEVSKKKRALQFSIAVQPIKLNFSKK